MDSLTITEFDLLKQTAAFTEEDVRYLRMSRGVLESQTDAILDVWYGFVGSHSHLLHFFTNRKTGEADHQYLAAVRERFKQWILDTASANYDQRWLDFQFEIGRRHHRKGKNKTDHVEAVEHIQFRYLLPLLYPVFATLKPFLAKGGHSTEDTEKMHQAWLKSLVLQLTLWSRIYILEGDY